MEKTTTTKDRLIMHIESESLFGWLVAAVGGIISVLVGIVIWNNRNRLKDLNDRLDKVEDRLNTTVPESVQTLDTKITVLEGNIKEVNTKLDLISDSVIQRMDKLERDMPGLIEAAIFRTMVLQRAGGKTPDDPTH